MDKLHERQEDISNKLLPFLQRAWNFPANNDALVAFANNSCGVYDKIVLETVDNTHRSLIYSFCNLATTIDTEVLRRLSEILSTISTNSTNIEEAFTTLESKYRTLLEAASADDATNTGSSVAGDPVKAASDLVDQPKAFFSSIPDSLKEFEQLTNKTLQTANDLLPLLAKPRIETWSTYNGKTELETLQQRNQYSRDDYFKRFADFKPCISRGQNGGLLGAADEQDKIVVTIAQFARLNGFVFRWFEAQASALNDVIAGLSLINGLITDFRPYCDEIKSRIVKAPIRISMTDAAGRSAYFDDLKEARQRWSLVGSLLDQFPDPDRACTGTFLTEPQVVAQALAIRQGFEAIRSAIPNHAATLLEYVEEFTLNDYILRCYIGGTQIPHPMLYFFDAGLLKIDTNSDTFKKCWQGQVSMVIQSRKGYRLFACGPTSGGHELQVGPIEKSQDANSTFTEQLPPVQKPAESKITIRFVQWGQNVIWDQGVWGLLYSNVVSGAGIALNNETFKNDGGISDDGSKFAVIWYVVNGVMASTLPFYAKEEWRTVVGKSGTTATIPNGV